MVQPRAWLWLRHPRLRAGRGHFHPHGDGSRRPGRRPADGRAAAGADREQRQGPDRGRGPAARRVRGLVFLVAAALAACGGRGAGESLPVDARAQTGLAHMILTIDSSTGTHRFDVELARTFDQQQTGMMFRHSVPANSGMLFPFDPPQDVTFWMKNTLVPLDMLFIRADRTIARVATAKALDLTGVPSGEPIVAVLEIRGGRAAELGI